MHGIWYRIVIEIVIDQIRIVIGIVIDQIRYCLTIMKRMSCLCWAAEHEYIFNKKPTCLSLTNLKMVVIWLKVKVVINVYYNQELKAAAKGRGNLLQLHAKTLINDHYREKNMAQSATKA